MPSNVSLSTRCDGVTKWSASCGTLNGKYWRTRYRSMTMARTLRHPSPGRWLTWRWGREERPWRFLFPFKLKNLETNEISCQCRLIDRSAHKWKPEGVVFLVLQGMAKIVEFYCHSVKKLQHCHFCKCKKSRWQNHHFWFIMEQIAAQCLATINSLQGFPPSEIDKLILNGERHRALCTFKRLTNKFWWFC